MRHLANILWCPNLRVVLNDDFTQGQRVEAGQSIMTIADESSLWVEAKVAPYSDAINKTTAVSIVVNGRTYPAKVIQEAHVIDHDYTDAGDPAR